jgi:carbamoyltransferase
MGEPGTVLGVSGDFHDAAAALVVDGRVVAAAEEERFTRLKHDPSLPRHAIAWCLESEGVEPGTLDHVVFYEKPLTAYERFLVTHAHAGVRGFASFARGVSSWSRRKLWVAYRLERILADLGHPSARVEFAEHHQSHAASAFYPSPFEEAAVVVVDGVGEWASCTIAHGRGRQLELMEEVRFPDSLGLFYSAVTSFCGFEVNDGEYKLMGLAPFGQPVYERALREQVLRIGRDGSFHLDQRWFDFQSGRGMYRSQLASLLDGPPRDPSAPLTQREADIARSAQVVLEGIVLDIARRAQALTGARNLCLAGGVALNCVANAKVREAGLFDDLWVQPAAGDSGGAVGAALWRWHQVDRRERVVRSGDAPGAAVFLGPAFGDDEVATWLEGCGIPFERHEPEALVDEVAAALDGGATVGWFQGRMELGPRALGHRSILADPRRPDMIRRINALVKQREPFRPFAPAVLAEHAAEWFEVDGPRPYMTEVAQVAAAQLREPEAEPAGDFGAQLGAVRSTIPACTHVDGSARVQTVHPDDESFHRLLEAFHRRTGCPVLLNTSFNRAGEPIVRTPADAFRCFVAAGLDVLVLGQLVVRATDLGEQRAS